MKGDISVLSLNCWGLYLIASKRQARLNAIADIIANSDHSIVALQEVWVQEDFNVIRTKAQVKLPFAKYFYGGVLGSGLAILSRYPIIESSYHCYKLAGRPLMILHGDYYVGKGCGSVCVEHPEIGIIEVFNTHLHAEYRQSLQYQSHLVSEAWELARLLRASVSQGRQVILAGDLNSTPTTYVYQIITQHGFMTDSWKDVHSSQSSTPIDISNIRSIDSAIIIQSNGATCSSPFNTWSRNFNKPYAEGTMGKRLDYIFYLSGSRLACIDSCVSMTEQVPRTNMSYSDHFGVHSTFRIIPDISVPFQPIHPCTTKLSPNTVNGIIALLTKEQAKSKKTSRTLLAGFISAVVIGLVMYGLLIGLSAGYGQKPLVPILVPIFCGGGLFFSVAVAPILLIAGFVFGNTEQRAHEQFINDLETFLLGYKDD